MLSSVLRVRIQAHSFQVVLSNQFLTQLLLANLPNDLLFEPHVEDLLDELAHLIVSHVLAIANGLHDFSFFLLVESSRIESRSKLFLQLLIINHVDSTRALVYVKGTSRLYHLPIFDDVECLTVVSFGGI